MASQSWLYNYNNSNVQLKLNVYTVETNIGGNYTVERADLWMQVNNASGQYWNNYNHSSYVGIGGHDLQKNDTRFDARSTGDKLLIGTWDTTVYHEANGSKQIWVSAWHNSGTGLGNASTGALLYTCDTIPRYANFYYSNPTEITVSSCRMTWATDASVDTVQMNINEGGWQYVNSSDSGTSGGYPIYDMAYHSVYHIATRVRRADSGLWTESGYSWFWTKDIARITSIPTTPVIIGTTIPITIYNEGSCNKNLVISYNGVEIIARNNVADSYNLILTEEEKTVMYHATGGSYSGIFRFVLKSYYNTVKIGEDYKDVTITWPYRFWCRPDGETTFKRSQLWVRPNGSFSWKKGLMWVRPDGTSTWKKC